MFLQALDPPPPGLRSARRGERLGRSSEAARPRTGRGASRAPQAGTGCHRSVWARFL